MTPFLTIVLFSCFVITSHFCTADDEEEWNNYKIKFFKKYANSLEEELHRARYKLLTELMKKHNKDYEDGKQSFKIGYNRFSDMTEEEYQKLFMKLTEKDLEDYEGHERNDTEVKAGAPESFSWVDQGWNTKVPNQGSCGSCYSFAAIGAIEGAYFVKHRKHIQLSEQDPVDCSGQYGNNGCSGGMPNKVYDYCMEKGVSLTKNYPYSGNQGQCKKKGDQIKIKDYYKVKRGSEEALKEAVANYGPIAVAIDTSPSSWSQYSEGIYYDPQCSSTKVTHAVVVVGYGTERGHDYWLVKNSWGPDWGQNGYIKMARNRNNHCGIANYATYPVF